MKETMPARQGCTERAQTFRASDGLELAYRIDDFAPLWREPDTVVLLHAAMGSMTRMRAWVSHLAGFARVVRMDLRGHGSSEIPGPDQLDFERVTRDVVDLLDALGLGSAHLAGSSAGGIIAMNVAIEHPGRVRTLASYAAAPGLKVSSGHTDFGGWIDALTTEGVYAFLSRTISNRFDLDQVDPRFVEWFLHQSARNDPALLARFVRMMSAVDLSGRVGEIRCPTLIVVPGGDSVQSLEEYELSKSLIPDCRFEVYEGLPHNITDAVPDRCAADLAAFLKSHLDAQ